MLNLGTCTPRGIETLHVVSEQALSFASFLRLMYLSNLRTSVLDATHLAGCQQSGPLQDANILRPLVYGFPKAHIFSTNLHVYATHVRKGQMPSTSPVSPRSLQTDIFNPQSLNPISPTPTLSSEPRFLNPKPQTVGDFTPGGASPIPAAIQ